jgi:hypothetical protein
VKPAAAPWYSTKLTRIFHERSATGGAHCDERIRQDREPARFAQGANEEPNCTRCADAQHGAKGARVS